MITKTGDTGELTLSRGRYAGKTVSYVAASDPRYLTWLRNSPELTKDVPDALFDELESTMLKHSVPLFPERKAKK
jgi:hypothetical protein